MHDDRCEAVAKACGGPQSVVGIELFGTSGTYSWQSEPTSSFQKVTLFSKADRPRSRLRIAAAIVRTCQANGIKAAFFCHYERPEVFLAALILRFMGVPTFVMNDSKFDDYPRHIWRELLKRVAHLPYQGGLAAGPRSADYMRFLGHSAHNIQLGYNAISVDRLRRLAGPGASTPHAQRDFLVVARLVPKKNIAAAIAAFAIFAAGDLHGRKLRICGAGPEEARLKRQVERLGLQEKVVFHGFQKAAAVAEQMKSALALLLPSIEEQFGLVVPEAQALGLPVIVSTNCGACDELVRSGVNGFVVEPDNPSGMAFFMRLLGASEPTWHEFSRASKDASRMADTQRFVQSVVCLAAVSPTAAAERPAEA